MDKLAITMYFGERGLRTARYKIWSDQNYTFCTICSLIDLHLETHDLIVSYHAASPGNWHIQVNDDELGVLLRW